MGRNRGLLPNPLRQNHSNTLSRRLSKTFHSEVRLTEGKEPLKTSGTYIYEQAEPLKIRNYGKLV